MSRIPEGRANGIPEDGARRIPEGGVIGFPQSGMVLFFPWEGLTLVNKNGCCGYGGMS